MSNEDQTLTPQQKRRAATAARLRAALEQLVAMHAKTGMTLSVAALARQAGVGRNAIYVNHRDVIADLLLVASQRGSGMTPPKERPPETNWRNIAAGLKQQLGILATENAQLLKRVLDAEQATAHTQKRVTKLEAELRALRPAGLRPSGQGR